MRRTHRVLLAPFTLLAVGVIAFALLELIPGDPAAANLGIRATEANREALRTALHLDGGALHRLLSFLGHLLRFDLGRSISDGRPVLDKIFERLPRSAFLAVNALVIAWALAVPLAMWRQRRAMTLMLAGLYAVPVPALAMGMLAAGLPYGASVATTCVAAVCLVPWLLPRIHAQVARAIAESVDGDAMRTLHAVGASRSRVLRSALRVHALRLVTLLAVQLPALLSGVVLVEAIFGLPGLGLLAFDAMAARDQPVLLGLVVCGAGFTILATLLVDLVGPTLDPRLSVYGERR